MYKNKTRCGVHSSHLFNLPRPNHLYFPGIWQEIPYSVKALSKLKIHLFTFLLKADRTRSAVCPQYFGKGCTCEGNDSRIF